MCDETIPTFILKFSNPKYSIGDIVTYNNRKAEIVVVYTLYPRYFIRFLDNGTFEMAKEEDLLY